MTKTKTFSRLVLGILVFGGAPIAAAEDLASLLASCKSIAEDAERLACYDRLASGPEESVTSATPVAPDSAAPAAVASATAPTPEEPLPLTDEVAKQEIRGAEVERPEYTAVVTRCQEARHEKRKFFVMDNGQVWQQSNAGRLSFRDKSCQFEVKLQKDYFGWVMDIPSEGREVRVKRVR